MIGKPTKVLNHGEVRWKVEFKTLHGKRRQEFYATLAAATVRQDVINARPRLHLPGGLLDPTMSVAAYGQHWLDANATTWKVRTLESYRANLEQHVLPFPLGPKTLGELRVVDVQRGHAKLLVVAKRKAGYAPDSVRLMFATLRALLADAADDELLIVNPLANAGKSIRRQLERQDTDQIKAMTALQLHRFLEAAQRGSRLVALYLAGARTGLRLGELCGWQLEDLRLEKREADVRRSLGQKVSMRNPIPGPTKTSRWRTVDLSQQLVKVLGRIKGERAALAVARGWRPPPPWVFITRNGTPHSQRNVLRDFDRVLVAAKLMVEDEPPPFSVHSLRHTFATLSLLASQEREALQYVQQQLGHSSIRVTVDTYGSWLRRVDPAAADRLDGLVASGSASGSVESTGKDAI